MCGNRRAADDEEYARFLIAVGDGTYTGAEGPMPEALHPASVRLPDQLVDPDMGKDELLRWVYPDPPQSTADELRTASYYAGRAIVTPTNVDADKLSASMLERLQTPLAVQLSRDEVLDASPAEKN